MVFTDVVAMGQEKGDRRERELVNRLDDADFAVMRAPASGGATERELPDVFAGNGDLVYAFESKSSSGQPIYIDEQKVEGLTYFAAKFGATPSIAVRFDREPWYFFHPSQIYRTGGGNYRVKKEVAVQNGIGINDLSRVDAFEVSGEV